LTIFYTLYQELSHTEIIIDVFGSSRGLFKHKVVKTMPILLFEVGLFVDSVTLLYQLQVAYTRAVCKVRGVTLFEKETVTAPPHSSDSE